MVPSLSLLFVGKCAHTMSAESNSPDPAMRFLSLPMLNKA